MYVIKYTSGSYDDFHRDSLFVTKSEQFAKEYCEKAGLLLIKIKEFYSYINNKLDYYDEKSPNRDFYLQLWCKYQSIAETNVIYYEIIEER